jgi:hypothetical protein
VRRAPARRAVLRARGPLDQPERDVPRQPAERPRGAAPLRIEHGHVRREDEQRRERRLDDHVGEGVAARAVDGVQIVDREQHTVRERGLVRAGEGPAERLRRDEAAVLRRQRARGGLRPDVAAHVARAVALAEDLEQPAARLRRRAAPVGRVAAVRRELCEPRDRPAERVVADLGAPRIGPGLDDDVPLARGDLEELAKHAGLADAVLADDAGGDHRALHVGAARVEPREILLARGERQRQRQDRRLTLAPRRDRNRHAWRRRGRGTTRR